MKVIFLDVDGVLNDWDTPALSKYLWYKKSCIEQLQLLVKNTGAKIVVSSTWKYSDELLSKLKNVLEEYGMFVHDVTPDLDDKPPEIRAYLKAHPEIEKYVVLDDDDFFKKGKAMTSFRNQSRKKISITLNAYCVLTEEEVLGRLMKKEKGPVPINVFLTETGP